MNRRARVRGASMLGGRAFAALGLLAGFDLVVIAGCPRPGPENTIGSGGGGAGATASSSSSGGGGGDGGLCPHKVPPSADGGLVTLYQPPMGMSLSGIALLGDYVYFGLVDYPYGVGSVRYDGTGASTFMTGSQHATYVTSDGVTLVLWTSGGDKTADDLYAQASDGGQYAVVANWATKTDASANNYLGAYGIFASGGYAYFTTQYPPQVSRARVDGSQQTTFDTIATVSGTPGGVAVDGEDVYWVDAPSIRRMKLTEIGVSGATPEGFMMGADGPQDPSPLAIDADRVYWIDTSCAVRSTPKSPDAGLTGLSYAGPCGPTPFALAIDETYVYWLTTDGAVQAARKDGGPVIPIAPRRTYGSTWVQWNTPIAIAVDCGAVYWTSPNGNDADGGPVPAAVFKAAKPSP